ncbi:hypothetical protein F2Q68_00024091 [Brassica cretica]|uniref:Uncharacterized protein n=1 Tax=Brassica cretica TaxID=69181 RepID=A0A8S9IGB1_BRACR|nr:hypothetical protein F2Q68_00024091 [Brassica cretica]
METKYGSGLVQLFAEAAGKTPHSLPDIYLPQRSETKTARSRCESLSGLVERSALAAASRESQQIRVRSSDRTDQTDRAIPRASRLELRLEPRPDDLTDRTTARLPRPTRHSKTHGRARLSLGREETKDGHAFLSGGPSGQSRKRPYLYPVHPSGSDEPGQ